MNEKIDSQPATNDFEILKTPDDTTQEKAVLKGFKYTTDVIEKNGLIRVIRVTIGRKSTLEKIVYTYEVLEGINPFISQLAVHGAKQKICDSATGFKSESDKWQAMKNMVEQLERKDWTTRKQSTHTRVTNEDAALAKRMNEIQETGTDEQKAMVAKLLSM